MSSKTRVAALLLSLLPIVARPLDAQVQASRRDVLTVGTATARRGELTRGAINVPAGIDSALSIPVVVINGARPGPVLSIVSGAHGTEYASIIAVEQLIDRVDPAKLSGTLILVPLVNIPSFEQKIAHVNPTDRKSMNRFYPGNASGTQTERASLAITKQVVEQSDHLIDLHGGDIDENLRPYSYWTKTGHAAQDSISREMALAFGLDYVIISVDRPTDPQASRYLENTATTRGKPSITAEAGRAGRVDVEDVQKLVDGSLGVMSYLKMLDRPFRPVEHPVWIERVITVASEQTGIFYPLVDRGTYVSAGAPLGYVTDYLGKKVFEATAPSAGVVLFVRAVPSMTKGETIANVGVISR